MTDDKNPHYVHTEYSRKVFWKNGVACGRDDDPDRVELSPGRRNYPTLDFALPRQKYELEKVERMLEVCFEEGKAAQRAAIGKLMKELISL